MPLGIVVLQIRLYIGNTSQIAIEYYIGLSRCRDVSILKDRLINIVIDATIISVQKEIGSQKFLFHFSVQNQNTLQKKTYANN